MKKLYLFLLITFIYSASLFSQGVNLQPKDWAVLVEAHAAVGSSPAIELKWEKSRYAVAYGIRKKRADQNRFPNDFIAELDSSVNTWTDDDVDPGILYEYEIRSLSSDDLNANYGGLPISQFSGFGYTLAGINVPAFNNFGRVLIIIDETMNEAIPDEIARYVDDLEKEGWLVTTTEVPRTEQFDADAVKSVKQIIIDEHAKELAPELTTVVLLGRIAVPYSGNFAPDAHQDHVGAWPADVYYGDLDENYWRDFSVNNTSASREVNRNIPGDGKFDQNEVDDIELAVGRIDFYDMPAFEADEYELMKKYLDKNHNYRNGMLDIELRGIVDDNFKGIFEGFASSGWRNFPPLAGHENVSELDWFTTLSNETSLFAYGCGGGSYTSSGGIGSTDMFASSQVNAVFTMLFGSYFGDWDSRNNFQRAALASEPSILTCSWAGRPHWFIHHMGFGYPIGYSTRLTQNGDNYVPVIIFNSQYPNGAFVNTARSGSHVALMGDPTLRLNHVQSDLVINPPTNLQLAELDNGHITIQWDHDNGEINPADIMFNIYKKTASDSQFELLNNAPISIENITDTEPYDGEVEYRIHAVVMQEIIGGSILNESLGALGSIVTTDVNELTDEYVVSISPNPASQFVEINMTLPDLQNAQIRIIDMRGNLINSFDMKNVSSGSHFISWNLMDNYGNSVSDGIYFLSVKSEKINTLEKIIVNR